MRLADLDELRRKLERQTRLMSASFEITQRCNQRCQHCLRVLGNDDGLAYSEVCSVLDQLSELGCLTVTFTGGEPLARRDFFDILAHACQRNFASLILTNGTLITAERAAALRSLKVLEVQVSLYAAEPTVHDRVTGSRGSYHQTLRGIAEARRHGLRVRVAMPVLSLNVEQVPAVQELCRQLGVVFTRAPLLFPRNDGDRRPLSLLPAAPAAQTDMPAFSAGRRSFADLPGGLVDDASLCAAGRSRLAIGSDGTVYPCDAWRLPVGNIHQQTIAETWSKSAELIRLRAMQRHYWDGCRDCGLRTRCVWCAGLSFELEQDGARPNAQDCLRTRTNHDAILAGDAHEAGREACAQA